MTSQINPETETLVTEAELSPEERLRKVTNRIIDLTKDAPAAGVQWLKHTSIIGEHDTLIHLSFTEGREEGEYIAVSQVFAGEGKKKKTKERRWDPKNVENTASQKVKVTRVNERGQHIEYPLHSGFRPGDLARLEKQISWFEEEPSA